MPGNGTAGHKSTLRINQGGLGNTVFIRRAILRPITRHHFDDNQTAKTEDHKNNKQSRRTNLLRALRVPKHLICRDKRATRQFRAPPQAYGAIARVQ